ncbi:hypothetical protein BCR33DRAFT_852839 [Rhizoclosmatium globosum]|uniref:Uncharacterized protein n=1 Tax=Rhizoclosmatium globosum TaxID=329046 RepID=A0A1Y2C0I0_9FUNG|nr:hypothetical protein BCR33DRAFT_852839 [Rhizoclosmatium globosum]|eukprot:ORY40553.1 hypothetical protein BCR33DRAFT_852839 [Rhizoclosmatium globosum]
MADVIFPHADQTDWSLSNEILHNIALKSIGVIHIAQGHSHSLEDGVFVITAHKKGYDTRVGPKTSEMVPIAWGFKNGQWTPCEFTNNVSDFHLVPTPSVENTKKIVEQLGFDNIVVRSWLPSLDGSDGCHILLEEQFYDANSWVGETRWVQTRSPSSVTTAIIRDANGEVFTIVAGMTNATIQANPTGIAMCHPRSDPVYLSSMIKWQGNVIANYTDVVQMSKNGKKLLVFSGDVLDVSPFYNPRYNASLFGPELEAIIKSHNGKDATRAFANAGILNVVSPNCFTASVVVWISTMIILLVVLAQFFLALYFKYVIGWTLGNNKAYRRAMDDLKKRRREYGRNAKTEETLGRSGGKNRPVPDLEGDIVPYNPHSGGVFGLTPEVPSVSSSRESDDKRLTVLSGPNGQLGGSMFQPFPQQTTFIPRHIQIDTKTLIVLLGGPGKTRLLSDISGNKDYIWNKCFRLTEGIGSGDDEVNADKRGSRHGGGRGRGRRHRKRHRQKLKGYQGHSFDHTIVTDGLVASLRYIHNDDRAGQVVKNERKKAGKERMKRQRFEGSLPASQRDPDPGYSVFNVNWNPRTFLPPPPFDPDPIFKLPKKRKTRDESDTGSPPKSPKPPTEFPYFDEPDDRELREKLRLAPNHIFIDPGKRSLLTMMDDSGKFLSYTSRQRLHETKQAPYTRLLTKARKKLGILDLEELVTQAQVSPRTCFSLLFREYVIVKLRVEADMWEKYADTRFRQYKWYGFINRKKSESWLVERMAREFGKDAAVIIGDWSISKHLRGFIPTPGIGLKRRLAEKFSVYSIDEFRTSIIHHKTEERCSNLKLRFGGKLRKLHAVLVYKTHRTGCINRDKNRVSNLGGDEDELLERLIVEVADPSATLQPTPGSSGAE